VDAGGSGAGVYAPGMASAGRASQRNQSVRKAIALLRATAVEGHGANVSALARSAGLPRATALRLIQTMEEEGFLLRVRAGDRIVLGPELVRLARRADLGAVLADLARPRLEEVGREVGETATLSVVARDGGLDVVQQVDGPYLMGPLNWVGQRFARHASSSGKVLLAHLNPAGLDERLAQPLEPLTRATITRPAALRAELDQVRRQGYATTVDELEEGLAGVSVGVLGEGDALVGVVNVSGLTQRLDHGALRRMVPRLRAVADALEDALRSA